MIQVKKILKGKGDTLNIMSPLIPFNMLRDLDVGLLKLINYKYPDERVWKKEFFLGRTEKDIRRDLYYRTSPNPLSLCIQDEYKDKADEFYNQFMTQDYIGVLKYSTLTGLINMLRLFCNEKEISPTVVFDRKEEQMFLQHLSPLLSNCSYFLCEDLLKKKTLPYNQYFFKYIKDIDKFRPYMIGKSIYLAGYSFNTSEIDDENNDNMLIIRALNRVAVIDLYDRKTL